MKNKGRPNSALICSITFAALVVFLFFHKDSLILRPWDTGARLQEPSWGSTNGERIVVIENDGQTITVLSPEKELLYRIKGKPHSPRSFYRAERVDLDEQHNLYVLDKQFGGAFEENMERILKYSPGGAFMEELYTYRYTNEDFIITKGKISAMAYDTGSLYMVRLGDQGFWLERLAVAQPGLPDVIAFFDYPQAFRDLRYFHINAKTRRLTTSTKAGTLKQYAFSGDFVREWPTEPFRFPWMVVADDQDNLIYTDMAQGEIRSTGTSQISQRAIPGSPPYTALQYTQETLFAARGDQFLIKTPEGPWDTLERYPYTALYRFKGISLFVLALVALMLGVYLGVLGICCLARRQGSAAFKVSLLSGMGVVLGAGIAGILLINHMHTQYNANTFLNLENISRLTAESVDLKTLMSITSPRDFEGESYRRLDQDLRSRFAHFQWKGKQVYQYLWRFQEGRLYSVYDTEQSRGTWYPVTDKAAYYQEVFETGSYIHRLAPSAGAGGTWLFVCGPIVDDEKHIIGLIETGYDIQSSQEQTRRMIIQMILMVGATAIALFFIMLECILIGEAFQANKTEYQEHSAPVFHPELLRGILFFMFTANNLESAILPLYAAALYQPVFNLPKAFMLTLPFTAEMVCIILALLVVPGIIGRFGLKRLCILAALGLCMGHILSFSAPNTLYLGLSHALTGFSTGTLVLVINTIIAAQRSLEDVNRGFAHYNASYLAGINVGVVFGSMVAEFFSYRTVYLCSSIVAVLLLAITVFSSRSTLLNHIYGVMPVKKEGRGNPLRLLQFFLRPAVLGTLGLLALPYMASMSFVSYFMPLYGTGQGLQESNIGQLMLLNGLFTILFGTSLCAYTAQKVPVKGIVCASLFLNAGAIYLFSLRMTVPMLVCTICILAVASIFAMTNIQTYYAALYKEDGAVSPAAALSMYSVIENLGLALGPLVFSYIASERVSQGLRLFSLSALGCLLGFMVLSRVSIKK